MSINKKIMLFCVVALVSVCVLLFYKRELPEENKETTNVENTNSEPSAVTGNAIITSASRNAVTGRKESPESSSMTPEKGKKKDEKKEKKASADKKDSPDETTGTADKSRSDGKTKKTKKDNLSAEKQPRTHTETNPTQAPSVNGAGELPAEASMQPSADVSKNTCHLEITCKEVFSHWDKLNDSAKKVVPKDGVILQGDFDIQEKDTAFELLKRACGSRNILLDYVFTPVYASYYIKGIHNLYEFDCGDESGWLYQVNGKDPGFGCNQYTLKKGDRVTFYYSCEYR